MSDGFDFDKVNLHQRGVVDQPHRLGRRGPDAQRARPSAAKRRVILAALVVLLVGVFVALLATGEADAPAEPAAVAADG